MTLPTPSGDGSPESRDGPGGSRWGDLRGQAVWVVVGCLVCQLGLGFTYVSRPLAGEIIEALSLSRTQFSAANTPQLVCQALASPLVGVLTVRLGASRVLALSAALMTAVFLGFARIESASGLYLAIAGVGLGAAGLGDISVGHVVSGWVRRRRGLALGIVYTGSNLGGFLMVALSGRVADLWSWREGLLSIAGVAFLVLLPTALLLVREPPERAVPEASGPIGAHDEAPERSLDLRAALRTPSFWLLTAALFVFFFYFVGVLDHLVLFLTDGGMDDASARAWFQRAVGLGALSKILFGLVADRMPTRTSLWLDAGLLAVSAAVLLVLPGTAWLVVFVLSFGFATAARDVVYPLIIGHCFGVRHLGEIYGAMMLVLLPGGALGPVFAAAIHDHTGSYALAFQGFAALVLLAFAALFFVRDERRPSA